MIADAGVIDDEFERPTAGRLVALSVFNWALLPSGPLV